MVSEHNAFVMEVKVTAAHNVPKLLLPQALPHKDAIHNNDQPLPAFWVKNAATMVQHPAFSNKFTPDTDPAGHSSA